MMPETIVVYFGTNEHNAIREELSTFEGHRTRVIEWREAMISAHVSQELEVINKRAHALRIQEAHAY
jgi:hypothetical protein